MWVVLPLVKPRKFVFPLLVPLAAPLEVVLIVKPAADSTSSRKSLRDIFPLHHTTSQLNDESIFLGRPLALLLCRGFGWMRRHVALPGSPWVGGSIGRYLLLGNSGWDR